MLTPSTKTQLEIAILWLEQLLQSKEREEALYQQFFEQNPIVFLTLGYQNFYAFTKESGHSLPRDEITGLRPEPDFIVERQNGLCEIFEIKTPVSKKLRVDANRYRERFTAEVSSYISQTITYEKYFTRNPANRDRTRELFGINIHEDLDIKIVIGLDDYIDRVKIHQKAREYKYKIDIITYDEILSQLKEVYQRTYGEYQQLPGISLASLVRFKDTESDVRRYFLDVGDNPSANRIALYLDLDDDLCFEVLDKNGNRYVLKANAKLESLFDEWICLICEFGVASSGFVMLISINGIEMDKRVKETSIELSWPLNNFTLGCDMNRASFGYFDTASILIFNTTLSFRVRYHILKSYEDRYGEAVDVYSEFSGHQFLFCDDSGNLTQDQNEYQPLFRLKA